MQYPYGEEEEMNDESSSSSDENTPTDESIDIPLEFEQRYETHC